MTFLLAVCMFFSVFTLNPIILSKILQFWWAKEQYGYLNLEKYPLPLNCLNITLKTSYLYSVIVIVLKTPVQHFTTSGAATSGTCKDIMAPNFRLKMDMEMGSMTKAAPCIICSGKNNNFKVHHIHYSTTWYNRQMSSKGVSHPMCHFCDVPHAIDNRTRLNVILTDSTLAGIQYLQGWGWEDQDPLHCDIEAIPGAKIVALKRAWERAYHRNPLPIDTVLVAGLNDIRDTARLYMGKYNLEETANKASEDIMSSIRGLHKVILEHSVSHNVKSTLAVATVLHVPALYWHKDNGAPPSPDYVNYKDLVDTLNLKIEAFNI